MRVLLVEDDADLASGLRGALGSADYAVDWVATGTDAAAMLRTETFDLVILDLTLPGQDGLDVLADLRSRGSAVPVLVITARGSLSARIKGLDLGADDYLGKPFELAELEARVRALLRRSQGRATGELRCGRLVLDTRARRALVDGEVLGLPRRELCLLEVLMTRAGQVVSKDQIASALFSFDDDAGPNAIELYVSRLRRRLGDAEVSIRTVRGLGYLLDP